MTDSQCMGRLLASATHDMRNVLAVIRESAGLAQDMVQLAAGADKPADPRVIKALKEAQQAHGEADNHTGRRHKAAQLLQLFLQRRGPLARLIHHARYFSHLGSHAGGRHHSLGLARGDDAAHEHRVARLFSGGHAFARQHGLVALQGRRALQPCICGNFVARLQKKHVARHHGARADGFLRAIAPHTGCGGAKLLQRLQRLLGAVFL